VAEKPDSMRGPLYILRPDWEYVPLRPGQKVVTMEHDAKDPFLIHVKVTVPRPRCTGIVIHNIGDTHA